MSKQPSTRQRLYAHLSLARISNSPTVVSDSLAGAALAGGLHFRFQLVTVALAMVLFYTAGMYLNDLLDYAIDARERPERQLPSGKISRFEALFVTILLFALGSLFLFYAGPLPFVSGLVLILAIIGYDAWHKTNPLSPLLMAFCRFLVYLTAFLSVSQTMATIRSMLIPGCLLFLYTVGLTYIAKTENKVSALNIGIVATIFLPTLYFLFHSSQLAFLLVLCFTAWAIYSVSFAYRSPKRQIGRAVRQLIAAMALLDALVLARTGSLPGVILALLA